LCGLAGVLSFAPMASAFADTLTDAMSLAYDTNPNLKAARAQLRATDEGVAIAVSGWRPSLILNGSAQREQTANIVPGEPVDLALGIGTYYHTYEVFGATLTQPLFNGFATVAGTRQARNQVYAQRARLEQSEAAVLLQVATSYFDVLENEALVDLNKNNVQVLDRNLEATNDRFRVGEITRTDVAQSEASLEGAKAALVLAEGNLQQVRAAYENVVGKPADSLVKPDLPAKLPKALDEAVDVAINDNPNYVANDYTARAQNDNIQVVESALLPQASFVVSFDKTWNAEAPGTQNRIVAGGVQVTVPLYQGGAEWARLRQAKDLYGQSLLLADQARLDARTAAVTAYENLQAQTASIDSIRSQISANEVALEGVRREAEVGSRTVLDVLITEQTLLSSRVQLVQVEHDQLVAAYTLLSAMGKLTGGDIGLGVKLYDPVHHYDEVRGKWIGLNSDTAADLVNRRR
jgi:outer membrane protein